MPEQIEDDIEVVDVEAYQAMMQEWVKILSRLWVPFGKVPTPEQLGIYQELLKGVPLGLLEKCIDRTIREHKYASVPTIGNVWDALLKELDLRPGESIQEAIEHWCERLFERIVYRFQDTASSVAVETEPIHATNA
jgi:hypothetical protein